MGKTSIQWTDMSWNPVRGCTRVSPGCGGPNRQGGCYAEVMAARFSKPGMWGHGFATMKGGDHRWTGKVELIESQLHLPLLWKKPRRIFVNSTSDLFHEALADEDIARVVAYIAASYWHTHQVLTKRPARAQALFSDWQFQSLVEDFLLEADDDAERAGLYNPMERRTDDWRAMCPDVAGNDWPLRNLWLGTSIEDNERARERIPLLQATPAAIRFISAEPLLENLEPFDMTGIHQVIVGGESGSGARVFNIEWARSILKQCRDSGVACFIKQLGANVGEWTVAPDGTELFRRGISLRDKKGGDIVEWPHDLCVREMPT